MSDILVAAGFLLSLWAVAAAVDTGRDQYLLPTLSAACLIASFMVKP